MPPKKSDNTKPKVYKQWINRIERNDHKYQNLIHWLAVNWDTIKPIEGTRKMRWSTFEFEFIMERVYTGQYRESVGTSLWRRISNQYWHYLIEDVEKVRGSENMLEALSNVAAPTNRHYYDMYTTFCETIVALRNSNKCMSRKLKLFLEKIKNPDWEIPEKVLELGLPRPRYTLHDYRCFNKSLKGSRGPIARMKFEHYFQDAPHVMPPYEPPDEDVVLPKYLRYDEKKEELNEEEKKIYEWNLRLMHLLETDLINGLRYLLEICKNHVRNHAITVEGMIAFVKKVILKIAVDVADRHPKLYWDTTVNYNAQNILTNIVNIGTPTSSATTSTAAKKSKLKVKRKSEDKSKPKIKNKPKLKSKTKSVSVPSTRNKDGQRTKRKTLSRSNPCREEEPLNTSSTTSKAEVMNASEPVTQSVSEEPPKTSNNVTVQGTIESIILQQLQAPPASRAEIDEWARRYSWQGGKEPQAAEAVVAEESPARKVTRKKEIAKALQAPKIKKSSASKETQGEAEVQRQQALQLVQSLKVLNRKLMESEKETPVDKSNLREDNQTVIEEQLEIETKPDEEKVTEQQVDASGASQNLTEQMHEEEVINRQGLYHQDVRGNKHAESTEISSTLKETSSMPTEAQQQYPSSIPLQLPTCSDLHSTNKSEVHLPVSQLPHYQELDQDIGEDQRAATTEISSTLLKPHPRMTTEMQQLYPSAITEQLEAWHDLYRMNPLREQQTVRQLPSFHAPNQEAIKREQRETTEVSPTSLNPNSCMAAETQHQYPSAVAGQLPTWSDQHPMNVSAMQWSSSQVPHNQGLRHEDVEEKQHVTTEILPTLRRYSALANLTTWGLPSREGTRREQNVSPIREVSTTTGTEQQQIKQTDTSNCGNAKANRSSATATVTDDC